MANSTYNGRYVPTGVVPRRQARVAGSLLDAETPTSYTIDVRLDSTRGTPARFSSRLMNVFTTLSATALPSLAEWLKIARG